MRRALTFVAAATLVACAEPASLRVTISNNTPGTAAIELDVLPIGRQSALVDCRLTIAGDQVGRCPFEASDARWLGEGPIVFLVYGEPMTEFDLAAWALDGAGAVLSSTRTRAALPASEQAARELALVLEPPPPPPPPPPVLERTEVHQRCDLSLPPGTSIPESQRDELAITWHETLDGARELIVATPARLERVRYRSGPTGCSVESRPLLEPACLPRGNGLVAGDVDASVPGEEVVLLCVPRSPAPYRLHLLSLEGDGDGRLLASEDLRLPQAQVSRPILADLDGDGDEEVVLVTASSTSAIQVRVWQPGAMGWSVRTISQLRPASSAAVVHAPIAVPAALGRDDLWLFGYRGGSALWGPDRGEPLIFPGPNALAVLGGAVTSSRGTDQRLAVSVFDTAGRSTLSISALPSGETSTHALDGGQRVIGGPVEVGLAIGDVDGTGALSAVFGVDGRVQVIPFGGPARSFLIDPAGSGVLSILLADLDRLPGAEVVAFDPTLDRIFAIDGKGEPLVGWPIAAGLASATNRVLIADLDGDGTSELVVLAFDRLAVRSLGPGSHQPDATPWPLPFHDPTQGAATLDERDPLR